MANSELIKKARANMLRLVNMELNKQAFTPGPEAGAMPPPGAGAPMPGGSMPADPSAMGGMPMDPSMMGGAPPMDPSMGGAPPPGGGDPTSGAPIVQVNLNDLMQMVQMMQQGGGAAPAPAPAGPAGAPNEPEKPKGSGGKGQALEGKIDALATSINMMIGLMAGQMGMNPQQLLEGGGAPPAMGGGAPPAAGGEGGDGLMPPAPGGEGAPPPEAPPLQPQASARRPQASRLHNLVGSLLR